MSELISCGVRRIQKQGRIVIGKDTMESEELKDGMIVEVFLKKKDKTWTAYMILAGYF